MKTLINQPIKKNWNMKKIILLFAGLAFLTFKNQAQTTVYHPFPDSSATWNIYFSLYCFSDGTAEEYYSITISGDTLINNQRYHKLMTPFVQSFSTGTCGGTAIGYKGAIRQDTTIKKVFYIAPTDTVEELLYDFTMQVGDTVRGYTETIAVPSPQTVHSIDSVLVGSSYRKRWNIGHFYYDNHFIEGVGSTYGLIERDPGTITDQAVYSVTCFQQNGNTLYYSPTTASTGCELITSINSIDNNTNQIKVFPNPSNGSLTIDFNQSIKEILLTDLLGNIILQQYTNNQTKFKINNLQSGIYILTVIDKNNKTTNRKIISCP